MNHAKRNRLGAMIMSIVFAMSAIVFVPAIAQPPPEFPFESAKLEVIDSIPVFEIKFVNQEVIPESGEIYIWLNCGETADLYSAEIVSLQMFIAGIAQTKVNPDTNEITVKSKLAVLKTAKACQAQIRLGNSTIWTNLIKLE